MITFRNCNWFKSHHKLRLISTVLTLIQFLVLLCALLYVLADILKAFCFWDTSLVVCPQDALCTVNTDQKLQNDLKNCSITDISYNNALTHISKKTSQVPTPKSGEDVTVLLASLTKRNTPASLTSRNWSISTFLRKQTCCKSKKETRPNTTNSPQSQT